MERVVHRYDTIISLIVVGCASPSEFITLTLLVCTNTRL